MQKPALALVFLGALAASLSAQTALITSEWETIVRVNGAQQSTSFPIGSIYGVGTNESQTLGGPGSVISSELEIQTNSIRIATMSSVNLLSGPGPTIDLISRGRIVALIPAGRGRLHMEGRSHASGGPGGFGCVKVDVFGDGQIDFAPPPTFSSPLLEFDILLDTTTTTPVVVEIDSALIGSTLLDEAFADVEMTWIPHQKVVLPDTHYLMERPDQAGSTGTNAWWRGTSSRFQILYEASHFVDHGVVAPITIEGVCFRGEDGERSIGGHSWAGAQVRVGATSLDAQSFGTAFSTNTSTATTTMGPTGTIDIVEKRSSGATPNNFNIVIDLLSAGAGFSYDPTSTRPNLLIDIVLPNGTPNWNTMMPMQDTTGSATEIRGAGLFGLGSGSATGNPSQPLVVGVQFEGVGGYGELVPARNELYGAGCGGSPSSFYQSFLPGQPFDLTGLTLTPDTYPAPNTYSVTANTVQVDPNFVNASADSTADNEVVAHSLGYVFEFPGGSTGTIGACTNGYVWLDNVGTAAFRPSVQELLGGQGESARLAPCWYDFHAGRNTSVLPQSGLHVRTVGTSPNRRSYITWLDVGVQTAIPAGAAIHRVQCVLHEATGVIEFRYGNMPNDCANSRGAATPAVVGFSGGELSGVPSVDPQSRDLSHEVPFATSIEGNRANMGLRSIATPVAGGASYGGRMFAGQSISWEANNVPPGAVIGAFILDFAPSVPGLSLPGIHAPGCIESTTIEPLIREVVLFPGATVGGSVPVNIDPGYNPDIIRVELYAQFVLLDLFGGPAIVSASSNAIKHTLGTR